MKSNCVDRDQRVTATPNRQQSNSVISEPFFFYDRDIISYHHMPLGLRQNPDNGLDAIMLWIILGLLIEITGNLVAGGETVRAHVRISCGKFRSLTMSCVHFKVIESDTYRSDAYGIISMIHSGACRVYCLKILQMVQIDINIYVYHS